MGRTHLHRLQLSWPPLPGPPAGATPSAPALLPGPTTEAHVRGAPEAGCKRARLWVQVSLLLFTGQVPTDEAPLSNQCPLPGLLRAFSEMQPAQLGLPGGFLTPGSTLARLCAASPTPHTDQRVSNGQTHGFRNRAGTVGFPGERFRGNATESEAPETAHVCAGQSTRGVCSCMFPHPLGAREPPSRSRETSGGSRCRRSAVPSTLLLK